MKNIQFITHIPRWETLLSWFLESIILLGGLYQLVLGVPVVGLFILVSLGIILYPRFFTGNYILKFPIEIEILLFLMVIFQLIVGETIGFYTNVPMYDKVVHYVLPFFIGLVAFLIFYTMQQSGRVKTGNGIAILFIILITLGIGTLWEIIEYGSDMLIWPMNHWHHFQGNALENAYFDTMNDLLVNFIGGIFGSLLGLWFLEKSRFKKSKRIDSLTKEIVEDLLSPQSNI